jgi:D-alanyl-D-alanine dipeptidase
MGACAGLPLQDGADASLVDAATRINGLKVEMRYAGSDNFVGRPILGYEAPVCLLTPEAANALAKVQASLAPEGLGLKVFDCYRPVRAVKAFAAWAKDPADQANKARYYPDIDKSRLFELGYIAERSGHSRGSTVDLTLVELPGGREVDMGSGYDLFDPLSWPTDPRPSTEQRANRMRLQAAMTAHGFRPLKEEWWHFTLNNEPYPNRYFDAPVRRPREALFR